MSTVTVFKEQNLVENDDLTSTEFKVHISWYTSLLCYHLIPERKAMIVRSKKASVTCVLLQDLQLIASNPVLSLFRFNIFLLKRLMPLPSQHV